ncbi:MarR family transcriptional regulator [Sphaerisporangium krabiense]|uniref:DNA-binding MarR family transcriptional regulator n=1 Tax=Sphaerisporangium krabiense TaxID=763782 RepID=A0A7W9DNF6_9ACTN|nr:MarR family transcriptional regulator [Sphaerisporangium krabiense]MBB5625371.1 DNA-binding MarR family transcriptional regulator [Sphaerisporangium krabiense]GII64115.1 MarR family transcriptional regulator [Sphaerisporangium krabiense]
MRTEHDEVASRVLPLALNRVAARLNTETGQALAGTGLTLDQWRVLDVLATTEGLAMSEIAAAAVITGPTLTRAVDRLVDRAYIYRNLDHTDRRRVLVRLSERGAEVHRELASRVADALAASLRRLDAAEAAQLRMLLDRLAGG